MDEPVGEATADGSRGRPGHGHGGTLRSGRHTAGPGTRARGRTAFVFQGGGSIAATQVGMLRALLDHDVRPDFVLGSSAGAINAVRFAMDPTADGVRELEKLWLSIARKDVFPLSAQELLQALLRRSDGLASSKTLRRTLEQELRDARLERLALPAHVMASDLASGDAVTLSVGPAVTALLATTALPGVFPPVNIEGRPLIDGGIAADTPVRHAEILGATVSYVLPCIGPSNGAAVPHGAAAVAMRALSQLFGRASTGEIAAARRTVHVLPAPANSSPNPFDFGDTCRLIAEGDRLVRRWLAHHRRSRIRRGSATTRTPPPDPPVDASG
jgi:NTE family protein